MRNLEAIFFDQDNTLFNTREAAKEYYRAVIEWLATKVEYDPKQLYAKWQDVVNEFKTSKDPLKRSYEFSLTQTLEGLLLSKSFTKEAIERFEDFFLDNLSLNPGVGEFFSQKKIVKYVLVTESEKYMTLKKLGKFELVRKFDLIVTSDETQVTKPDSKYFELAWRELNLTPENCIYVGDNWEKDCKLGQEKGGTGVVFGGFDHRAEYEIMDMRELDDIMRQI
jgi:putative hydrolase of the HAD superfamily